MMDRTRMWFIFIILSYVVYTDKVKGLKAIERYMYAYIYMEVLFHICNAISF